MPQWRMIPASGFGEPARFQADCLADREHAIERRSAYARKRGKGEALVLQEDDGARDVRRSLPIAPLHTIHDHVNAL